MRQGKAAMATIDDYIAQFPPAVQAKLRKIRAAIRQEDRPVSRRGEPASKRGAQRPRTRYGPKNGAFSEPSLL